jgi:hypothetical protein
MTSKERISEELATLRMAVAAVSSNELLTEEGHALLDRAMECLSDARHEVATDV